MQIIRLMLAIALCGWLPGFFMVSLIWPREEGLPILGKGVLSAALSAVVTSLIGLALAGLHRLNAGWAWGAMLALTAVLAGIWLGRRPARPRLAWSRRSAITAFILLVTLAVVLAPRLYLAFGPNPIPLEPDSWAYMADTTRIIAAGTIPERVYQWGIETTFPTDKVLFLLFSAVFQLLSGLDALGVMTWVTLLYAAAGAAALWLWLREFLPISIASALTMLVFHDDLVGYGLFSNRFGEEFFRAEGFALMLGFAALWLTSRQLHSRGQRLWPLISVLLAVMALSHGVAALSIALLIAALFAGHWLVERLRGTAPLELAKIAGGAITATGLLFLCVNGVPQPHFAGVLADSSGYQQFGDQDPSYLLKLRLSGKDDGLYLYLRPKSLQRFYESPARLWELLLRRSFPPAMTLGRARAGIALFLLGALLLCGTRVLPSAARAAAAGLLMGFLALYGIGLFFSWRYENYALALHGANREFPYGGLCVMVLAGILASAGRQAFPRCRPWMGRLYGLAWAIVWLALLVPGYRNMLNSYASHGDLNRDGMRALQWIAQHTPSDAVLLVSRRTAGSVELLAGRRSLTEGRGAYLRPEVLAQIFRVMDQAECFFHDPTCTNIITTHHVDVVLFAPAASIGGNLPDFAEGVDQAQLDSAPYLQNIARFGGVYIYQVNHTLLGTDTPPGQEVAP